MGRFLEPYRDWPVTEFGPYQLLAVRKAMLDYRYNRASRKDAARLLLEHVSSTTTDIYLLDEVRESMNVARSLTS